MEDLKTLRALFLGEIKGYETFINDEKLKELYPHLHRKAEIKKEVAVNHLAYVDLMIKSQE